MLMFFRRKKELGPEEMEVKNFLANSYHFKQLTYLYEKHKGENRNGVDDFVPKIKKAESFWQIYLPLSRFDPDDVEGAANYFEFVIMPKMIYAGVYLASYINDTASIAYHAINLYCDAKAKEHEYQEEKKRANNPYSLQRT